MELNKILLWVTISFVAVGIISLLLQPLIDVPR